jgi:hypothetical protein
MSRSTTTVPTRASSAASALIAMLALAGCVGYGPGPLSAGQAEQDVRDRMGAPTAVHPRPDSGGHWLEYARGPMGLHTYRIDIDAAGRVVGWRQLMTEANFDALPLGATHDAVREQLGRPAERRVGWRGVGEVWSYRFESPFCRWFQVWLVDGVVREASYADDPACTEHRHDRDD